ncbi:hypothetical protein GCM10022261_24500 [Brevibacterium daeguense]|uniref:DUF2249 domain-containing protein n=1 Tax=Brevibacterium daeguense TaxID=909936 RepID=A0ABP8ELQ4_9MICO
MTADDHRTVPETAAEETVLDLRQLPRPQRHPQVFRTLDELPAGGSFVLVNDHDPEHLWQELEADLSGAYAREELGRAESVWRFRITKTTSTSLPRILVNTRRVSAAEIEPDFTGAVWKLQARGRDLDSNIIALPPEGRIDAHRGPDNDVLIHVLTGSGTLSTEAEELELQPGDLLWMPRRSERQFTAGQDGLKYLTVHVKRQALTLHTHRPEGAR